MFTTGSLAQGFTISNHFFSGTGGEENFTNSSSGGSISAGTSTHDRVGLANMSYTSAATDRANLRGTASNIIFGGGPWFYQAILQIVTLANVTDDYVFFAGFADSDSADSVDGAYFEYDRATSGDFWVTCTANNSVRTKNTLSNAVSAGTYVRLGIQVNAGVTEARFFIDGALVQTHTTNIPSTRSTAFACGFRKTSGTGSATVASVDHILIDYGGISWSN